MAATAERRPDARGYFGRFGGQFAPETLMPAINELTAAYEDLGMQMSVHSTLGSYLQRLQVRRVLDGQRLLGAYPLRDLRRDAVLGSDRQGQDRGGDGRDRGSRRAQGVR